MIEFLNKIQESVDHVKEKEGKKAQTLNSIDALDLFKDLSSVKRKLK